MPQSLPRVMARRWYVTLPGLAFTVGLCAIAAAIDPASYQATARIVLVPPAHLNQIGPNPYAARSGSDHDSRVKACVTMSCSVSGLIAVVVGGLRAVAWCHGDGIGRRGPATRPRTANPQDSRCSVR